MMSSFPLVSFLITLLLTAAVSTHGNEQVKDTAGNPVLVGEKYLILPVNTNAGGLVPAVIDGNRLCPLGIALVPYPPGLPVSIYYKEIITKPTVNTSVDVIIEFRPRPSLDCNGLWEVDDSSPLVSREPTIFVGGSRWSSNSSFKIEKAEEGAGANTYKLTAFTGTVGTTPGGIRVPHLVLTNNDTRTLLVKFYKVGDDATTSTSRVDKLGLQMFPFY